MSEKNSEKHTEFERFSWDLERMRVNEARFMNS